MGCYERKLMYGICRYNNRPVLLANKPCFRHKGARILHSTFSFYLHIRTVKRILRKVEDDEKREK